MRILLINPDKFKKILFKKFSLPCLGLGYLAAQAERAAHTVRILDMNVESTSPRDVRDILTRFKPDLVGISVSLFTVLDAVAVASFIKSIKDIPIIVGGKGVTYFPHEIMVHSCFDFGQSGEAEHAFVALLDVVSGKTEAKPEGLIYRAGGETICHGQAPLIQDLDALPFPARHLFKGDQFHMMNRKKPCATIVTARGCPFQCVFCDNGGQHRCRSVANILEEFKEITRLGYQEIYVCDDTFTSDKQRVLDLCRGLVQEKIGINWSVFSRIDTIDGELLEAMKEAGCYTITFGLESGSDKILDTMNKGITKAMIREKLSVVKRFNYECGGTFVVGFPGETCETMQETYDLLKNLEIHYCVFSYHCPVPNSPFYRRLPQDSEIRKRWIDLITLRRTDIPIFLDNKAQRAAEMHYRTMRRIFYLQPHVLLNIVRMMIQSPLRMKNFSKMGVWIILSALLQIKSVRGVLKTVRSIGTRPIVKPSPRC
ncbi:radical SAM protein [bacterium]|nr:radical SAM protein [bacterium]